MLSKKNYKCIIRERERDPVDINTMTKYSLLNVVLIGAVQTIPSIIMLLNLLNAWCTSYRVGAMWLQHPYTKKYHNLYKQHVHQGNTDSLVFSVFHVVKFCAEKSFKTDDVWHVWILLSEVLQSQDPVFAF